MSAPEGWAQAGVVEVSSTMRIRLGEMVDPQQVAGESTALLLVGSLGTANLMYDRLADAVSGHRCLADAAVTKGVRPAAGFGLVARCVERWMPRRGARLAYWIGPGGVVHAVAGVEAADGSLNETPVLDDVLAAGR